MTYRELLRALLMAQRWESEREELIAAASSWNGKFAAVYVAKTKQLDSLLDQEINFSVSDSK